MTLTKIRYKGLSDIREMSKKDLAAAGVGVDGDLRFHAGNRHTVFVEDISDALLEVLKAEGTFTVTKDADKPEGGEDIIKGQALDDTGSVVRDGTTGQTSTAGEPDANAAAVPSGSAAGRTGRAGSAT
jgi:hypothetical protein